MRIAGRSNAEICRELEMSMRTLIIWWSDDLIKARMEQMAKEIDREFCVEMARGALRSFDELVKMATAPMPEDTVSGTLKIEAIREVLDRVPGTNRLEQAQETSSGDTNQSLVFANMSDGQLLQILGSLGRQQQLDEMTVDVNDE